MKKGLVRQWVVVAAVMVTIVVNGLANALPLNGQTTGEISDRFQVYFVPAGYVFSIWGLIYLGLVAYAIYQVLPAQRETPQLERIGYFFVASCLANIAWIFLWHYEVFVGTLVAMLVLLGLLIAIYLRLGIGRTQASRAERWLVHLPFSVYLGWITVATIANVTSLLDYLGWRGGGLDPAWWAVIMLVVATAITTLVSLTRRDVAYVLVIIWAFMGIAIKHAATALVSITAALLVLVLAVVLVITAQRGRPMLPSPAEVQPKEGVEGPAPAEPPVSAG